MKQVQENTAASVQKSHSVPNVNGHMQQQQSRDQGVPSRISNLKNNGTGNTAAEHDLHEGKRLLSFNQYNDRLVWAPPLPLL